MVTKREAKKLVPLMQIAIYVMAGGGFVGRSFAEQPKGAYVDGRVSKRPYAVKKLMAARDALVMMSERAGYDASNLPKMPEFTNMGKCF